MKVPRFVNVNAHLARIAEMLEHQAEEVTHLRAALERARHNFSVEQLAMLSPLTRRNVLQNDSAALQKLCVAAWAAASPGPLDHKQLLESGFRVFSQGDEDGILLRIFQKVGTTNKIAVEIGSNCDGSDLDIPENLSTNLLVNHGWHGVAIEMEDLQCQRIRHFFAQHQMTKHFHAEMAPGGYFSPRIVNAEVTPDTIDALLAENVTVSEPDLMIIDIDGGDFAVMEHMTVVRPRVLVVEFEKRFREFHSVVQRSRESFGVQYAQSGAASLAAWNKLLMGRGYILCSISGTGFNAFFVRADVAVGALQPVDVKTVFDDHAVFAAAEELWLNPDDSWTFY